MGNIFADCQRCSNIVDQCDACAEFFPRRDSGQSPSAGQAAGLDGRGAAGGLPGGAFRSDLQPANMTEADLIRLAQQRSRLETQQQRGLVQLGSEDSVAGGFGHGHMQRLADDGIDPTILNAAILASHASLPVGFRHPTGQRTQSEDEIMAQAIQKLEIEEESKQRARLRDEQSREYEESLRVDRQREIKRQQIQEEEEQKRKAEDEAKAKLQQEEERKHQEEEEANAKAEEEEKARNAIADALVEGAQGRLKDEPPKDEAGRIAVLIRTPEGKALKRAFRDSEPVSLLYDFAIAEGGQTLACQEFRLISNMPRCVYEDREATLQGAGLQGQSALLVEIIEPDEPGGE